MNQIAINQKLNNCAKHILNIAGGAYFVLLGKRKYGKMLKKNAALLNSAICERVYVVGNGPSLKKVDLNLLKGKDIITMNKSILSPVYKELMPKYHVVLDKEILGQITDAIEEDLKDPNSKTIFILHRSVVDKFAQYDRAYFFFGTHIPTSDHIKTDLTKNVTTFMNVLPFATLCAIAIGYKSIVMLGNDFSFFAARKEQHFYDVEDKLERKESLYQDLSGCAIVLLEYRCLYKYAVNNNIEVYNATEGSLLDEIPQKSLESLL